MIEQPFRSPLGAGAAPVYLVTETTSTMDDARRLVANGAPSGTVVVADHQTAGRGRRSGRVWHSAPRESLMFTAALERPAQPVTRSLVMAAAVARLLETEAALDARVKWPNDVLVDGRKICGILADHDGRWLFLGVGLNVRQAEFPPEIADLAISLRLAGADRRLAGAAPALDAVEWPVLRDRLLVRLLDLYLGTQGAWHTILSERLWLHGERVDVVMPGGERVTGELAGIAADGRLIVAGETVHRLAAGEVSLYRKDRHG